MSLLSSLSFPGRKVVAIDEDAVAYVSGNGVCILSLSTNEMSFIAADASATAENISGTSTTKELLGGVSALASCGTTQQLAISSRSMAPTIDVYEYPSMEKSYSLKGGADLDFADIAFSSNGTRVAAIAKLPDFSICVWNTRTQKMVCRAKLDEPCNNISFNPLKDDQLCVSGEKGLFMWSLRETQSEGMKLESVKLKIKALDEEDEDDDSGGEQDPDDDEDFEEAQGPRNDFVCHCWNASGQVHAATRAGEAFTVTSTGANIIETFPAFYASSGTVEGGSPSDDEPRLVARAMFPTKTHIVTVHSDGKIRWLAPHSFDIQRVVDLSTYNNGVVKSANSPDDLGLDRDNNGTSWMVPVTSSISPGYLTVVVGTADGMVLSLPSGQLEISDPEDFDLESFAEGGADVVVRSHVDCHADSVYAMCSVQTTPPCVFTAAADGSIRMWDATAGALVHKMQLNSQPFVCADASPTTPVVAVGSVDGVLRVLLLSRTSGEKNDQPSVSMVYEEKLFDKAITQLSFHPELPYLAVTSMAENRCYVIDLRPNVMLPTSTISVSKPYSAVWGQDTSILITTGDGILFQTQVPALSTTTTNSSVDPDTLRTSPLPLSGHGKFVRGNGLDVKVDNGSTLYVANDTSKFLQQFTLSKELAGKSTRLTPESQHALHAQPVLSIASHARQGGTLLATGGKDGSIGIWETTHGSDGRCNVRQVKRLCGHSAGVVRMCFTSAGDRLMSSSVDGSVLMWKVNSDLPTTTVLTKYPTAEEYESVLPNLLIDVDDMSDDVGARSSYMSRIETTYKDLVAQQNEKSKFERLAKFHDLRLELQNLIKNNTQVDELEKLETDEFIINLEEKERLEKEGDERAAQVQRRIESENATRSVIRNRLMNELWNSMEEKGKEICSVKQELKVTNFPVPNVMEDRQTTYERAFMHRRIELREIQQSYRSTAWPGVMEETNSGTPMNWMVNEGTLSADPDVKTDEQIAALEAAKASSEENKGEDESQHDAPEGNGDDVVTKEEELLDMLYRPLALRTNAQKRIQILLLEQLIREMKISFNKKFDNCFATKEEKLDEIRNKNGRIQEILSELKVQEEYFQPKWNNSEFPERVVEVADSEIPVEKYVSEAERKRLAEEEEERKRLAAMNQGDNAPERALMEMMGGTLEQEQGLNALEQELVREEWMVSGPLYFVSVFSIYIIININYCFCFF